MTTAPRLVSPIVVHDSPSARSVLMYWLARIFLKPIYRLWPLSDRGIRALCFIETAFARIPHPGTVENTFFDGVAAQTCLPKQPATDALAGAHILYLHGGAFLFCGPATHRHVCATLPETLGVPVHSLQYRQLPDFGVGASAQDAYTAYRALSETVDDPSKVIVAGDSAGGFLAAKICEPAERDGLPRPAAFVGYSPQLSLDADRHDPALLKHDAYQPLSAVRRAKAMWMRGDIALSGSHAPIDTATAAFPPTFLIVAERELLEPDILAFTDVLREAGTPVQTHRWRRGVHAFPVLASLLPESRESLELTGEFLRATMESPDRG